MRENPVITATAIGCWGAYPGPGEATSSFLLHAGGLNLLLDCGSGVLSRLQRFLDLAELNAVVLSHYHWDHAADIGCLQYAARIDTDLGRRRAPLTICGHREDGNFERLDYLGYTVGRGIEAAAETRIGPLRLTFMRNPHPDPCLSVRLEADGCRLVYITDTGWDEGLAGFAAGADLLICESSLYDEYRGRVPGHLCAGEAGRIAAAAGVKRLVLTHLPHWGEHARLLEQARQVFAGEVALAAEGSRWEIRAGEGVAHQQ
jgi:ribonuclease BN (tRNA processing enzyme)